MEATILDGGAASITAALERKKTALRQLIARRRDDRSFRDGLQQGVQHYCAAAALHDLHLAQLKHDYTRGTREHMREVQRFLSSAASENEFELRGMLNFVLGLLGCYVAMTQRQADTQAASALSNLDPRDLACV